MVSGPYCHKKYDAGQGIAVFVKNPYYPGNVEGIKPSIEKITLVECGVQSAMAGLKDGSIDLINQCVSADMIDGAIADGFAYELYPRRGLGYVCFACERKLLSDSNVRRAITCATDRSGYAAAYLGNYGVPTYGYYGMRMPHTSLMGLYSTISSGVSAQDSAMRKTRSKQKTRLKRIKHRLYQSD